MVSFSSWRSDLVTDVLCPKIGGVYPRLPSHIVSYKRSTLKSHDCVQPVSRKVPGRSITHLSLAGRAVKCASFVERNYQSSVNDDEDPFWINATKQGIRAAKSILEFLVEQPSQLKYIEWPGFQSTDTQLLVIKTKSQMLNIVDVLYGLAVELDMWMQCNFCFRCNTLI
ncbi:uncharacterized protein LOC129880743 isoform X1 [Solanum dulcamara]|uniref:uncharacterized protein LOC129880743 isoform X1 n=1 Tax=Solanum dulcamara TaxID=45834 RepID=UPI0024858346|nr:uncharacterized protein LOC129880743 isoform X1 [Solanum dulcamara]